MKSLTTTILLALAASPSLYASEPESTSLHLIVMDPLAAPLSCPCVEGYAQRKYEALAGHLEKALNCKVQVAFAEALSQALEQTDNRADLIVGKDSVVRADAKGANLKVSLIAALTDKLGATDQHGLIVVRAKDPARQVADLAGYEIIFGPAECDEKHSAAIELLTEAGVSIPKKLSIDQACSDGACKVIERGAKHKVAAVISSYAAPLLEGCGTIKKGDLRVVGKTKPVPFITAFVSDRLPVEQQQRLRKALLSVGEAPDVCEKLESLTGFVSPAKKK